MDAQAISKQASTTPQSEDDKELMAFAYAAWEKVTDEIQEGKRTRIDTSRFVELYGLKAKQAPLALMFETFVWGFEEGILFGAKLQEWE